MESLPRKIQNSRGERLGSIALSDGKLATVYMNPPPRKNARAEYPRLQKRTMDTADILVVVEAVEGGFLNETAEFSFKDTDANIQSALLQLYGEADLDFTRDTADLKRMGTVLLSKFGVSL